MDFELPETLQQFQQEVRAFVGEHVRPRAAELDASEAFPEDVVRRAGEAGYLSLMIPEEFGGRALGNLGGAILVDEVSQVCPSSAVAFSVHNSLVCGPLRKYGNDEQRQRFLPRLASGEFLGAYALSEAGSGSDAAALSAKAVRNGETWKLDGAKLWITSGTHAGLFIVFVRTAPPEDGKKHRGISAFLVEADRPGVRIGKKEDKLGLRASSTVEILLDGVEVPDANLLGEEGRGFRIAMETLDGGRIGIAAQAAGITQGCLDASLEYVKERRAFGRPLADFQAIQWKLADMATRLDAARLLIRRAAQLRDRGLSCVKEAAMAKLAASTLSNEAASEAVQIHGANGYRRGALVERLFRDARVTEIYEGTTEIQRLVIARALLNSS